MPKDGSQNESSIAFKAPKEAEPTAKVLSSPSPDSAVFVSDNEDDSQNQNNVDSTDESVPCHVTSKVCHCTSDPTFSAYGNSLDARRMSLLKSLSQDSEYSLDTSFFSAEEFLEDLGFAGSAYPTIPDRFMPSLIERISACPETAMESLNDRILLSIGRFRRKVGKRRLFRNLSMGKDANVQHRRNCHLCPNNSESGYPLVRSNTGPSRYSDERLPASNPWTLKRKEDLVDNDSEVVCKSPVAIHISEASDHPLNTTAVSGESHVEDNSDSSQLEDCPNFSNSERGQLRKCDSMDGAANEAVRDDFETSADRSQSGAEEGKPQIVSNSKTVQDVSKSKDNCLSDSNAETGEKINIPSVTDLNGSGDSYDSESCLTNLDIDKLHYDDAGIGSTGDLIKSSTNIKKHLAKRPSIFDSLSSKTSLRRISVAQNPITEPKISTANKTHGIILENAESTQKFSESPTICPNSYDSSSRNFRIKNTPLRRMSVVQSPDSSQKRLGYAFKSTSWSLPSNNTQSWDALCEERIEERVASLPHSTEIQNSSNFFCHSDKLKSPEMVKLLNETSKNASSKNREYTRSDSLTNFMSSMLHESNATNVNVSGAVSKNTETNHSSFNTVNTKETIDSDHDFSNPMSPIQEENCDKPVSETFQFQNKLNTNDSNFKEAYIGSSITPKTSHVYDYDLPVEVNEPLKKENSKQTNQRKRPRLRRSSNSLELPDIIVEGYVQTESKHSVKKDKNISEYRSPFLFISPKNTNDDQLFSVKSAPCSPLLRNIVSKDSNCCCRARSYESLISDSKSNLFFPTNGRFLNQHNLHKLHQTSYKSNSEEGEKLRVQQKLSSINLNSKSSSKQNCMDPFHSHYLDEQHQSQHISNELFAPSESKQRVEEHVIPNFTNSNLRSIKHPLNHKHCIFQPKQSVTLSSAHEQSESRIKKQSFPTSGFFSKLLSSPTTSKKSERSINEDRFPFQNADAFQIAGLVPNSDSIKTKVHDISCFRQRLHGCPDSHELTPNFDPLLLRDEVFNSDVALNSDLSNELFNRKSEVSVQPSGLKLNQLNRNDPQSLPVASPIGVVASSHKKDPQPKHLFDSFDKILSNYKRNGDVGLHEFEDSNLKHILGRISNGRSISYENLNDVFSRKSDAKEDSVLNHSPQSVMRSSALTEDQNSVSESQESQPSFKYTEQAKKNPHMHARSHVSMSIKSYPLINVSKDLIPLSETVNKTVCSPCTPNSDTWFSNLKSKPTAQSIDSLVISKIPTIAKSNSSHIVKKEAMLERKIRVFSKLLSNLSQVFFIHDGEGEPRNGDKNTSSTCRDEPKTTDSTNFVTDGDTKNRKSLAAEALVCLLKLANLKRIAQDSKHVSDNDVISSANSGTHNAFEPIHYKSGVYMLVNVDANQQRPKLYHSSVYMEVKAEGRTSNEEDVNKNCDVVREKSTKRTGDKTHITSTECPVVSQKSPCGTASDELETLQQAFRKAKESRLSTSGELRFLQEILQGTNRKENNKDGNAESLCEAQASAFENQDVILQQEVAENSEALSDLRKKSKRDVLKDTDFFQEEIKKVKQENEEEWQARLSRMESRLQLQEQELHRVQEENRRLRLQMDSGRSRDSPTCSDKSRELPNGHVVANGLQESEEEDSKPSSPTDSMRQDCDRLQEKLLLAEQREDELNLLFNQKIIELNRLQLNLSKQTKEMIELEKSYIQLQCRMRRGASKPSLSRLCSKTLPFGTKNIIPRSSPPHSPRPGV